MSRLAQRADIDHIASSLNAYAFSFPEARRFKTPVVMQASVSAPERFLARILEMPLRKR